MDNLGWLWFDLGNCWRVSVVYLNRGFRKRTLFAGWAAERWLIRFYMLNLVDQWNVWGTLHRDAVLETWIWKWLFYFCPLKWLGKFVQKESDPRQNIKILWYVWEYQCERHLKKITPEIGGTKIVMPMGKGFWRKKKWGLIQPCQIPLRGQGRWELRFR